MIVRGAAGLAPAICVLSFTLGVAMFTTGCGAAAATTATRIDLAASAPIDDAALKHQLVQGAQLLHEGGRTVPMATLISQLARTSHKARLPAPDREPLANAALYARARAGVVVIGNLYKCDNCDKWHVGEATGFVISRDGLAVTNHHVINRASNASLVAMTADGRVHAVREVLAASEVDDLAVIRLDGTDFSCLPISTDVAPGDRVRVVSHPDGEHYALTAGIVSRIFAGQRAGKSTPVLQITADFAKGSSGAPVLDDAGNVVGVVSYTRSIHHDNGKDKKRNLQMVMKNTTPAARLRALLVAP